MKNHKFTLRKPTALNSNMRYAFLACTLFLILSTSCQDSEKQLTTRQNEGLIEILVDSDFNITAGEYKRFQLQLTGLPAVVTYEVEVFGAKSETRIYIFDFLNYEKFVKEEEASAVYDSDFFVIKKEGTWLNPGDYYLVVDCRESTKNITAHVKIQVKHQK
jgi:hypothetical protein